MNFKLKRVGDIRTRFAPAPTGLLHIGSARTALFNYLFAKKHKGSFVLRIEDTDKERSEKEFEKDALESLKWLGIEWQEGPDIGNKHGPYKQSKRLDIYKKYLEQLLADNKAYYCFCSQEDLESYKQEQQSRGEAPRYSGKCAQLSKEDAIKLIKQGRPSVIRFRMPSQKVKFNDLVRDKVEFDAGLFGDIVIAKSIKKPLYNFTAAVDDYKMKITHIIRGEDHISNTPKQILLQKALGFNIVHQYAHIPLILGPDKAKLSKRHGAVAVSDYQKQGYLPEALVNYMALLGWHPEDDKEVFSIKKLVDQFSIEKVQKSGAIFNTEKLDFLNGYYIRRKPLEKLTKDCIPYLMDAKLIDKDQTTRDFEYFKKIVAAYQERLKKLSEIPELVDFFFKEKLDYDKNLLQWKQVGESALEITLEKLAKMLSKIDNKNWTKKNLEKVLVSAAEKFVEELKKADSSEKVKNAKAGDRGYLLWPLRALLSGKKASATPFEIASILGKEKTLKRIKHAQKLLTIKTKGEYC